MRAFLATLILSGLVAAPATAQQTACDSLEFVEAQFGYPERAVNVQDAQARIIALELVERGIVLADDHSERLRYDDPDTQAQVVMFTHPDHPDWLYNVMFSDGCVSLHGWLRKSMVSEIYPEFEQ